MNTKDNYRTIHTHLYSKIASEILRAVEGQLSDGMWENSRAMEKYWLFSNIDVAPDGEILIKISTESGDAKWSRRWTSNGFLNMSDDEIRRWFAGKAKAVMVCELKDNNSPAKWSRTEDVFETAYLSYNETIHLSDVYFVYDTLLGRDTARKYSVSQHMKIAGMPANEAEVKAEIERREQIAMIEQKINDELKTLDREKLDAISKIEAEYAAKRSAIITKMNEQKAALKAA